MISVIDYGVANIGALMNMHKKVGIPARRVDAPDGVLAAKRLLLPGVGSFDNGVTNLRDRGLFEAVRVAVEEKGIPIMGICLGMQLLGKGSEEGRLAGLGLIDGRCARLNIPEGSELKFPHQGWARPTLRNVNPLLPEIGTRTRFYFSHSYHLVCDDPADVAATAWYGEDFTAVVGRDRVWGVQFHPEKSHRYGMELLRCFAGAAL